MATLEKIPTDLLLNMGFHCMEYRFGHIGSLSQLCLFLILVQPLGTHWLARVGNREDLDAA